MAAMTSYLSKKLLDHTLGLGAYTMPTTVYASLHTADPTVAGLITAEVTGTPYARQSITSKMNATDAITGVSINSTTVIFGPASVDWGTITHVAISDALTSGNMLLFCPLTEAQTTPSGESVQFSPSQFIVDFS